VTSVRFRWRQLRAAVAACLVAWAPASRAHDTWFAVPAALAGAPMRVLTLGTGNRFPLHDSPIGAEFVVRRGCSRAGGAAAALQPLANTETTLVVRAPSDAGACWAQLAPFEVELAPDKIALYLDEVRPPPAIVDAWAALHARGLPWKERYTKHARVDFGGGDAAARPSGLGMDVLLLDAPAKPAAGDALLFRVLRDGAPLAGFAVELRHAADLAGGTWLRTGADGRVAFTPPRPGSWLLRGVDLRLSATVPDTFESRFVTLAFDVAARTAGP
jgi:hypothetical protein